MALQCTVDKVKTDLRIATASLDDDISALIDECVSDLRNVGVTGTEEENNIFSAIRLYVRANVSDGPDEYAKWFKAFETKKAQLMIIEGDTVE